MKISINNNNNAEHQSFYTLLFLIKNQNPRLLAALITSLFASLFALVPYWILFLAIEVVLLGQNIAPSLWELGLWMGAALIIKYLLFSIAYYFSHKAAFNLLSEIRQKLIASIIGAPILWLGKFSSGELKMIIMQDVDRLEKFIAHHSVEMASSIFSPLLVGFFLFWLDWRLALASLVVIPITVLTQTLFMRQMKQRFQEFSDAEADLNTASVEYIRNIAVMKAFEQDTHSFQRLRNALDRHSRLITKVTHKTVPSWSIFMVMLNANVFFILPLGIWLHTYYGLSLATLVLSLIMAAGMLQPLFKVIRFSSEIKEILVGVERISLILQWQPDKQNVTPKIKQSIAVHFKSVSFSYDNTLLLQNLNLQLKNGQTTALVGTSGAGKSTLVHLLTGLVKPITGNIFFNDQSLHDLDDASRSRLIAIASQEVWLFKGSILENLLLANPQAKQSAIQKAVKVAQAEEFILSLPDGYNSLLDERGVGLSGGERQRLAIARALIADTPVLVLDEATAFADSLKEYAFYQALAKEYPDKTILIVAHRLFAIQQLDNIMVMDKGMLIDTASHSKLLNSCAVYQQLWQHQQQSQQWVLGENQELVHYESI